VSGRAVVTVLVLAAAISGGAMYFLQVWGLYDRLPATDRLTVATADGPAEFRVTDFRGPSSYSPPRSPAGRCISCRSGASMTACPPPTG